MKTGIKYLKTTLNLVCVFDLNTAEDIEELIKHRGYESLKCVDNFGDTLLHEACAYNKKEFLPIILHHGYLKIKNEMGNTPFLVACKEGSSECVEYFLDNVYTSINKYDMIKGFIAATLNCGLETVIKFIKCGFDINDAQDVESSILHRLAIDCDISRLPHFIYFLKHTSVDVNRLKRCKIGKHYKYVSVLQILCMEHKDKHKERNDFLEAFVRFGKGINYKLNFKNGYTALHYLIGLENGYEKFKIVLRGCLNLINERDKRGSTVLHIAYMFQYKEYIDCLIKIKELDKTIVDSSGFTAMEYDICHDTD